VSDRPRVYKTEGLILRRRNLGEADSIFTVFSDREGKFDAIARGVRKARSRMRGHLEPLTRSHLMLAKGRSLDVFTQAETITAYRAIREDLERTALALYCAELVDRFTIEHAENPGLYDLVLSVLDALEAGAPAHVVRYFELHLLALSGYELQLDACASCGARLPEGETLLAPSAGGLVCADCRAASGGGRILTIRAIKVLRFARTADLETFAGLRIDDDLAHLLRGALGDVLQHIAEAELRSSRYVDDVARLSRVQTAQGQPTVQ
jgi:DNA repair protein RecO (recombination protein O)